ncbi:hypothetical protein D3C73_1277230 [compost metagenome]
MRFRREPELARLRPAANLHVVFFRLTYWNRLMGNIRNAQHQFGNLVLQLANFVVQLLNPVRDAAHFSDQFFCRLSGLLQLGYLTGYGVAAVLKALRLLKQLAAAKI